ncbi:stealth family protein [Agrococcus sp. SL85]|uniref:stealth family protein n=1 Tax=Agrococcus sp. SL85 TaxID=2995141 RepID=UPI00226CE032|nr:stealth family protein [Agrococcus sp. SL85]WAC66919.1 stealth family protein [Agrococcus sp. SL85]
MSTAPELVLVPAGGRFARFRRDDLVLQQGRYALRSGHATPRESMVEDLLAIAAALDAAGIPHLLVRDDASRPILAVDRARRKQLAAVLAEAFAEEPFYAEAIAPRKAARGGPVLLADGRLAGHRTASAMRLHRPRVEPAGRLRYGRETAVQLELWRFGEDTLVAPLPNAIMRATMPRHEAVVETVERFGREWQTIQHMWEPLASDVSFDIDIVFSWVDGSSDEFQRERAKRMRAYVVGEGDDSEARFRQIDELRYALRSVHMHAPWIRRIFIATDSPAPAWLAEHPKVTLVPAEAMFADPSVLPTHNSHAVEAQLHRIDGLAEHFLYANDDMFFGRAVSPDLFFSPGGITKFVEASTRIGLGETHERRSGHDNAARTNRRLLRERFGAVTTRHLEHCAAPLRRSVLHELEATFPEDFRRTAASRFRSASDISVTNSLYHYFALMTGRAVQQKAARVLYVETTLRAALPAMERLLRKRDQDMFCLNDGSAPELEVEERTRAVRDFLEAYFSIPAPWERDRVVAAPRLEPPVGLPQLGGVRAR